MSLLADRFRAITAKYKDKTMSIESTGNVCYSTGFITFDYLNGYITHVENEKKNMNFKYPNAGIQDGTLNMLVGRSQSGKTTFAMQIGFNIVAQFKTACFFHDDVEGGINDARKRVLTGITIEELKKKYICRDTGVHSEDFYERIKLIHDEKLEHMDDYSYDTGLYDECGNRMFKLEPTVYLLDSFPMLTPKENEDKELNNMTGATTARHNTQYLRKIIPMLKAANIILLVINHILPDISVMPKKGPLRWLKQGERLMGGDTPILLSNNTIRFEDRKLSEKDGLGIPNGMYVEVSLVKSRQNNPGNKVTLIFDPDVGYDPDLSLLMLLKDKGMVNSGGAYMSIGDRTDVKFRQKEFKARINSDDPKDAEFQEIVMNAAEKILTEMLNDNENGKVVKREGNFKNRLLKNMMKMSEVVA